jgi:hypothetical protein
MAGRNPDFVNCGNISITAGAFQLVDRAIP